VSMFDALQRVKSDTLIVDWLAGARSWASGAVYAFDNGSAIDEPNTYEMVKDKATELTGGDAEDLKADRQASDIVKSNDL
jgi:hypothetical protein